jgi:Xaa-Pro aminopeptidase
VKSELDNLMEKHGIDALLVTGAGQHNAPMVYLTGGGHMTSADLIKKRGEPPVLFYKDMERDEAAKSGLETRSYKQYPWLGLLKAADNNILKALVMRYQAMFADLGLTGGKVAIYGKLDAGQAYDLFSGLQEAIPDLVFSGSQAGDALSYARVTKDQNEIERIRQMGQLTVEVVGRVHDLLSRQKAQGDTLVQTDGAPWTIKDVKSKINMWLAELGVDNPEDCIFSIGKDAGVPHSSGNPQDHLRLGQTIIFDIFPCETGGGYFYDFTRTWCLGYAPDEVQKTYEQVFKVYKTIRSELTIGQPFYEFQKRTCKLFEGMGHSTIITNPTTESGYVHSIGHGLGLQVHEMPWAREGDDRYNILKSGMVLTIEPGLYYPERGLGVRLEDTVWITPEGEFETFVDYPYDLIIPVKSHD